MKTPELPPGGRLHGLPAQTLIKVTLKNKRLYNMDSFSHLYFEEFPHTDWLIDCFPGEVGLDRVLKAAAWTCSEGT